MKPKGGDPDSRRAAGPHRSRRVAGRVTQVDVLGLGAVAVDDLIYVDQFPGADDKVQVRHTERQGGGLAATALVAAARLGVRCRYAGTLGRDELSAYSIEVLESHGIDLRWARRTRTARVFHSRIVVGTQAGTRSIFSDGRGVIGASPAWPPAEVLRACRVLLLDHVGIRGMWRAARIGRRAGIPLVADLERDTGPEFSLLFDYVDHLILSRDFATVRTGETDPLLCLRRLWNDQRVVVIVTDGPHGCWSMDRSRPAEASPAPDPGARAAAAARALVQKARTAVAPTVVATVAARPGRIPPAAAPEARAAVAPQAMATARSAEAPPAQGPRAQVPAA